MTTDAMLPKEELQSPEGLPSAPPSEPQQPSMQSTINELLRVVQLDRAKKDKVPVGSYRCETCNQVHQWDEPGCSQPEASRIETFQDQELRRELRRILITAYQTIPAGMEWCRIGNEVWEKKCAAEGKTFVRAWKRTEGSSAVLYGPTGAGKTIAAIALMHKILDAARDLPPERVSTKKLRWASGIAFVSAPTLALARRRHGLGQGEAPIVELAMRASLLVLDEVGYEFFNPDQDTTLNEVLDHRYLSHSPTIITTELSRDRLKARYRDAIERRMAGTGLYHELIKRG